jgi:hypothetical protein
MNERDNRLDSPLTSAEIKHTAFGIWLQIASALDQVINFYRPNNDPQCTGWEDGFPGFEDMIGDGGETLSPSLLGMSSYLTCRDYLVSFFPCITLPIDASQQSGKGSLKLYGCI